MVKNDGDLQVVTNRLQKRFEEDLRKAFAPHELFAMLVLKKLKRNHIRLSTKEKEKIRAISADFFRTGDCTLFNNVIKRKQNRRITVTLSARDAEKLQRAVLGSVDTIVKKTTLTLARQMEPEVRAWADATCKWATEVRSGFQKRMQITWRGPFRQYGRLIRLAEEICQLAIARFNEKGLLGTSRLARAILFLHTRACIVAGEVEALMHSGYADGSAARWRTLHEIAVTAAFLIENGEDAADRYLSHFGCEQLKTARLYQEHRRKLGFGPISSKRMKELETQVAELRQIYGDDFRHDYGWAAHALNRSRVSFVDIEDAVKLSYMRPFYRVASEQVHASSRGAIMRVGLIKQNVEALELIAGPSNYGFADTAINSARSLMLVSVVLGRIASTLDINVMATIMARWSGPLMESFARAQREIEKRESPHVRRPKTRHK